MKRYLIFGEIIFDYNVKIKRIGWSIEKEFKTPKFLKKQILMQLGGAGRVYNAINIITKKKNFFLSSFQKKIENKYIINLSNKNRNIEKYRFWLNKKKIFQVNNDQGRKMFGNKETLIRLKSFLKKNKKNIEKIIISDYSYGLIDRKKFNILKKFSKDFQIPIYYDCQVYYKNLIKDYIRNIDYFFCNANEFKLYCQKLKISNSLSFLSKAIRLKHLKKINFLVVKLGSKGSLMVDDNNKLTKCNLNLNKKIKVNSSGAGDFYLSKFSTLPTYLSKREKLLKSNFWAIKNIKLR
jgi:bifunctional ADP-heptose synthase (sugar kinase/adenylyltransferase)